MFLVRSLLLIFVWFSVLQIWFCSSLYVSYGQCCLALLVYCLGFSNIYGVSTIFCMLVLRYDFQVHVSTILHPLLLYALLIWSSWNFDNSTISTKRTIISQKQCFADSTLKLFTSFVMYIRCKVMMDNADTFWHVDIPYLSTC